VGVAEAIDTQESSTELGWCPTEGREEVAREPLLT